MEDSCFEWPMFRHACRQAQAQAQALDRMMQLTGVAPVTAATLDSSAAFLAARGRCIVCQSAGECRDWRPCPADGPVAAPEFCANSEFIARCLVRQAVRAGAGV